MSSPEVQTVVESHPQICVASHRRDIRDGGSGAMASADDQAAQPGVQAPGRSPADVGRDADAAPAEGLEPEPVAARPGVVGADIGGDGARGRAEKFPAGRRR